MQHINLGYCIGSYSYKIRLYYTTKQISLPKQGQSQLIDPSGNTTPYSASSNNSATSVDFSESSFVINTTLSLPADNSIGKS